MASIGCGCHGKRQMGKSTQFCTTYSIPITPCMSNNKYWLQWNISGLLWIVQANTDIALSFYYCIFLWCAWLTDILCNNCARTMYTEVINLDWMFLTLYVIKPSTGIETIQCDVVYLILSKFLYLLLAAGNVMWNVHCPKPDSFTFSIGKHWFSHIMKYMFLFHTRCIFQIFLFLKFHSTCV